MQVDQIANTAFRKLVGKWRTEGRILGTEEYAERKITGIDTYEVILKGFFVLHIADVQIGDERSQTHEIIGWHATAGRAILQYYNNLGLSGRMTADLKDNKFLIDGDELRFRGEIKNQARSIEGRWEKLVAEGKWVEFMKMNLTRMS